MMVRSRHGAALSGTLSVWVAALWVLFFAGGLVRAQFGGAPETKVSAVLNTRTVTPGGQQVIAIVFEVPEGYHAQSATPSSQDYIAFTVTAKDVPGAKVHPAVYPKGKDEKYELLGTLNVYTGKVVTYLPVTIAADAAVGSKIEIKGTVGSQICDDKSCFPPNDQPFSVTAEVVAMGTATEPNDPALFKGFDWSKFGEMSGAATQPATKPSASMTPGGGDGSASAAGQPLENATVFGSFVAAFVVGLVFNVMPCVLPVLPLKAVGFIQAAEKSQAKSILLGAVFSAGLIAVFAALGVAIFGWGFQWGFLFQQNWFVYGMALVLVFMALSQWGLWTFKVPMGLYSFEPRHDTVSGNFLFGGLTALLSTPCTAYVFPALLAWGAKQTPVVGILLLCTVGAGMALPYFIMSCFPAIARKIPRTGPWSEMVKQLMGFLILAVAVYFVGTKHLSGNGYMWPVAVVATIAGIFLIFRTKQLMPRPRPLAIATVLAVVLTVGSFSAAAYLNRPPPEGIVWVPYSETALADARKSGNIVLIDFTANWCANCHWIENNVFTDPKVVDAFKEKKIKLLRVDITNTGAPGSDLLTQLNPAGGIPLTAIYFPGQETPTQIAAVYTKATLLDTLKKAG